MLALFTKALKWFIFMLCLIVGFRFIVYMQHFGAPWAMPTLLCFGGMYLLSSVWTGLPAKALIISVWLVIGFAGLGHIIDNLIFLVGGWRYDIGFFTGWGLVSFFVGIPVMMWVYHVYD